MQTIKIGFGYKARRGKDIAAGAIVRDCGGMLYVRKYAFADELREEIKRAVFDRWVKTFPDRPFDGPLAMENLCCWAGVAYDPNAEQDKDYPFGKQRPLYQWWGTEYRRAQDADYWVKRLNERIERDRPVFAVLSDLRFMNEFDFCDFRIRCDRPGFEMGTGEDHVSEHVLDVIPAERWNGIITALWPEEVEKQALMEFHKIRRCCLRERRIPR